MTIVLGELKDIQDNIDDKIARIRNVLEDIERDVNQIVRSMVGLLASLVTRG